MGPRPYVSGALLFGAALILYLAFQSGGLDDFDSFSFALALDQFDIALQQPHPPGFPVYVAAARLLRVLLPDPRAALTLLSALGGAVAVAALAGIGAAFGFWRAGLLAGLWLLTLPGFWLLSGIALSDVPGLALVLLAILFLLRYRHISRTTGDLVAGAVLAGLCLGVRPQNALPVALIGLYALWPPRRARLAQAGLAGAAGLAAVLLWLLPMVSASGGPERYVTLLREHGEHVVRVDSLVGRPVDAEALQARLEAFGAGLSALVGDDPLAAVLALAALGVGLARTPWRSRAALLCAAWLALAAGQLFLLESLERPRLFLPLVPPLALMAAFGWARPPRRSILLIPALIPALSFAMAALPLAVTLTRELPPPEQAAAYVAARYPADQSIIVSLGSFRAAQVRLAAYPQLYLGQFDAAGWEQDMASRQPQYLVLFDRDDVWPEAYAVLAEGGGYVPIDDRLFARDRRVFPQHSLLRLQVLMPVALLSPDQLAPPESGAILPGDAAHGRYFGQGWYRVESIGGVIARWTAQTAVIRVALPPADTRLTLEAAPFPDDQSVEVVVNGQSLGRFDLRKAWAPVGLFIPGGAIDGHALSTIELRHARAASPPGDNRTLAAAYRAIRFGPD